MKFSPMVKAGLAAGGFVALLLFLIVVDLGVNAGRIHYGVSVTGVDLGGMTRKEATKELRGRGRELQDLTILLTAEGLNVGVNAGCVEGVADACLGWEPNAKATTRAAYDVGRRDAPFGALEDRVSSWLWGTKVDFIGRFDSQRLEKQIDAWDERLSGFGKPLDRDALERLLQTAVAEGDEGPFEFPTED